MPIDRDAADVPFWITSATMLPLPVAHVMFAGEMYAPARQRH
jgi:hypothetical protein